uniref:Immunoglobulin V-set domain-containing protein n=1 Tax=Seriola dumerili TaxID=41447 RepID=A0A3B4T6S3_SERDU
MLFVSPAQHHVKCPTETIQAEEGDDVTLRFDLDPRVNLEDYTLDIKRDNKIIHVYRHGKDLTDPQMERYRNGTTLIHEDLSRGIVTLQISSVQLKDSGPYQCFKKRNVDISPLRKQILVVEEEIYFILLSFY